MLSNNKDWFYYSSYWRKWYRVLVRGGGEHSHQVEIPITPLNDNWMEIQPGLIKRWDIRYNSVLFERGDKWTHHLPDEVYTNIKDNLGKETADFLIHADILPMIDWFKYNELINTTPIGGVPFKECQARTDYYFAFWQERGIEDKISDPKRKLASLVDLDETPLSIIIGGVVGVYHDHDFYIYGRYNVVTKMISIEMLYSRNGAIHNSHWGSRMHSTWSDEFISHIEEMYKSVKITGVCYNAILTMIRVATANLHVMNIEKE
jgi:hypothetical protein